MSDKEVRPLGRREWWFGCIAVALVGMAAMVYLHGSGLMDGARYHGDLTQSPHWIAYHGGDFAGGFSKAWALGPLLYKYFTPPARIGEMISTETMKGMWESGISTTVTLPLWKT